MLKVEHLARVYDDRTVGIEDVSFEVDAPPALAVIGLSGPNKVDSPRHINEPIELTEGRVLWSGVDTTAAG